MFSKWSAGPAFLCPDSVNTTCAVNNTVLPSGNAPIDAVIADDMFFYAMPLFDFVGIDTDGDGIKDHLDTDDDDDGVWDDDDACPLVGPNNDGFGCPGTLITNTVTVDGKVWGQPDLFTDLSWNDIDAVCPAGVCAGTLNGYNMAGWKWASVNDVNALFNFYIGSPELGPGPSEFIELESQWAPDFSAAGFRPTSTKPMV